jgi:hypothetical protein
MQRRDFVAETVFLMGLAAAPDLWAAAGKQTGTPLDASPGTPVHARDEGRTGSRGRAHGRGWRAPFCGDWTAAGEWPSCTRPGL